MGALAGGGRLLLYLACFLGGPFSRATLSPSAIVAGIVGAAVIVSCLASWAYFALAARRSPTGPRMVPWLVLGAYSLLSGITAGFFRIKFGTDQALATRYVTFSLFGFIALAHVAVLVFQDLKPRTKAQYRRSVAAIGFSGLAVVAVLQAVSAPVYLREMAAGSRDRRRAREALRFITVVADPGPAAYLHLDIKEVRERAAVLDRLGLLSRPLVHDASLPAAPAATAADARYGRLESLVAVGDGYEAVGWAAIPERRAPADIVLLACERGGGAPIATMVALPAAPPWNRAAGVRGYLAEAGWRARLRRAWLPEGTTRISAWGFDRVTGEFHELAGAVSLRR
ncbi:MAG: hypothetical protein IMZ55_16455 [Acidobacteria bacterium]|nr:hypothetical protein [Acidobacteriota bacterium]